MSGRQSGICVGVGVWGICRPNSAQKVQFFVVDSRDSFHYHLWEAEPQHHHCQNQIHLRIGIGVRLW